MYKIKILLPCFLFVNFLLISQDNNLENNLFYELVRKETNKYQNNPFFNKASIFFYQKNWDSTLIYSTKALKFNKPNKFLRDYCLLFRGRSLQKKGLLNDALKELNQISESFKFRKAISAHIGEIKLHQKKYKEAITYLEFSIHDSDFKNNYIKKTSINHNLGLCYLHLKKYKKAETFLNQSIKLQEQQKDTLQLIGSYGDIATLYYDQYKDDLAIPFFKKAYQLAKQTISFNSKYITSRNMSTIEENRKNFQKALVYRKEAQQWKDSLNDQNKIYAVAQAEKEFAIKEKQKEVDFLQVQNQLKESERKLFLYSAIGLLLLLGVGLYFYREKIKTNKVIFAQKETLDELNATKDKLFSIVSHDLRSSVNALKNSNSMLLDNVSSKNMEALENLVKQNSAIVNGAYGLLDNLLNWALLQTNQGYFQISALRLFIIVEHVAYNYKPLLFEKELTFENSVTKKAIAQADQESLKIILRNLLDNAIKFSKPKGTLKVYTTEAENYWNLIVEDDGLGMSENTKKELLKETALLNKKEHEDVLGTGLGLSLVKSMIAKNHGKFDIESTLGKGTKMIVSLPKTTTNG